MQGLYLTALIPGGALLVLGIVVIAIANWKFKLFEEHKKKE